MNAPIKAAPRVSVVLPVYNPGPGIHRCIASLRGQTLGDIELIFVDDRGDDGAMEAVRAAAREDARVRVLVNPENLGAGPSRNAGIEAARGEYVSFVDPDDFVAPDFLELLYRRAQAGKPDIVKGSTVIVRAGDDPAALQPDTRARDFIRTGLQAGQPLYAVFGWEHWTAIYRRECLMESGARYGTSRNSQDTTFLLRVCLATQRFAMEERARYYYVMREGSAVHVYDRRRIDSLLVALREQADSLKDQPPDDQDACGYLYSGIASLLKAQIHLSLRADMASEAAAALADIRAGVCRLTMVPELARRYFPVYALVQYGACLPPLHRASVWEEDVLRAAGRVVANWVDFALAHPELKQRYWGDLAQVFTGAFRLFSQGLDGQGSDPELAAFYRDILAQRARLGADRA